jgi:hypothetical protein
MNYTIHPFRGVGAVEFGMTPEEVRSRVRSDFKLFKRSPDVPFPSDYFPKEHAFFYYDASGLLEAIEFAPPARPTVNGLDLFSLTFGQAVTKLAVLDDTLKEGVDGAIAHRLGVSIWAPSAKYDRNAPVESVLAFRKGYYD